MSVQFVIGNSGSGKTEYMFRYLTREAEKNPKKNYLVMVPEQFTLQTQKKLVDLSSHSVIMNVDVLSFKRLAYRVFDDLGITDVRVLEETGKNLVIRKIARRLEDKLPVLGAGMNRMGYVSEVKSLISELMQYNISDERLLQYLKETSLSSGLQAKLGDVARLYGGFLDYLRKLSGEKSGDVRRLITAEELLTVLKRHVWESELLRDAVIAFDEFTGFTPLQNELLAEIMKQARALIFSVTMDAGEDFWHSRGSHELFAMPKETIRLLRQIAAENGVEVKDPVVLGKPEKYRYKHAPSLAFLEKNIFRPGVKRWKEDPGEVSLSVYRNRKEELVYTARAICRLVREKGVRYREIGVVTGDVEGYGTLVPEIFEKYRIPCFVDATTEVLFHPFIEFLRAILEVVRGEFSYEGVFRFLRCGFTDIPESRLDLLENYLRAAGIRGKSRWSRKWTRLLAGLSEEDLLELNRLREEIYGFFHPLITAFSGKKETVRRQVTALYELCTGLSVEDKLLQRAEEFLRQGDQVKAAEYQQIYGIVIDFLDKFVKLFGDEHLEIGEFQELLDAGLDAANVASVPPGYDSVTFGDIERTRQSHIKVLFFIGINDGVIPKAERPGGIISQYERELLRGKDLPLAKGAREETFIQRYYLYLNMTKPSDALYLSYVRVDAEGKTARPSYLAGILLRLFPEMRVQEPPEWTQEADYSTRESAEDYLVMARERQKEDWLALARFFLEKEGGREPNSTEQVLDAAYACYTPENISRVVAEKLYGRRIRGSVTRLERFASCAYAHFLQYGLRLLARQEAGFAGVDMGNIYHEALERYSHKLELSDKDWFSVDEEMIDQLAEEAMDEIIGETPDPVFEDTGADRHMVERMRHIFRQTVWVLTRQVQKGRFVPEFFEISFQEAGGGTPLELSLGQGRRLVLDGRMDRVDTCLSDRGYGIKVIDYKSGGTKFDLLKIYQGTQLQLMVYMNAALSMAERKMPEGMEKPFPGGVFYYHIDDPVLENRDGMTEEEAREALIEQLRPSGLVNDDENIFRLMDEAFTGKSQVIPVTLKKNGEISQRGSSVASEEEFAVIREFVEHKLKESGKKILDGDIEINPRTEGQVSSCTYCPYGSVCGFDPRMEGYGYQRSGKLSREELLERMKTETAVAAIWQD